MGLRVVFDARTLASELPMTGIPRYLLRLLEALNRHPGMERPTLVTDRELTPVANNLGEVKVLPTGVAWQQRIFASWLRRHREQFDLLHNPAYATPLFHSLPTVTTVHDLCFRRYPDLVKPAVRRYLARSLLVTTKRSDLILLPTEDMRQEMIFFYPRSELRLRVTRLAGAMADSLPERPEGIEEPYFLWVGTREPRKNLGTAVAAMRAFPHVKLVVVGEPEHGLVDDQRLGEHPRVVCTGYISDAKLRWLYQHAMALIFSSLYEGFGMPVVEAMQEGCPVVCGEVPGVREVGKDACIFVDITSVESLMGGMKAAADDLWNKRARLAGQTYSWASTADATVTAYQAILGA